MIRLAPRNPGPPPGRVIINRSSPLAYGLKTYYPGNWFSTGHIKDVISGQRGQTFGGAVPVGGSPSGRYYSFNGSDSYIELPASTGGYYARDNINFTVAFWIYISNASQIRARILYRAEANSTDYGWNIVYDAGGQVGGSVRRNTETARASLDDLNMYDQWRHYTFVWTPGGNALNIYLNGEFASSSGNPGSLGINADADSFRMGTRSTTTDSTDMFEGYIGDVMIWNRHLQATEIRRLYNPATRFSMIVPTFDPIVIHVESGGGTTIPASATDGIVGSEATIGRRVLRALATDSTSLSDPSVPIAALVASIADQVTLSELLTSLRALLAAASDQVVLTDFSTRSAALLAQASDQTILTDQASVRGILVGSASDQMTLSETVAVIASLIALVSDGVTLSDVSTAGGSGIIQAMASDSVIASEALAVLAQLQAMTADGSALSDQASALASMITSLSDGVVVSDQAQAVANLVVAVSDQFGISVQMSVVAIFHMLATDTAVLSDLASLGLNVLQAVAVDSVTMIDSAQRTAVFRITTSDDVSFSETINVIMRLIAIASDTVEISDVAFHYTGTGLIQISATVNRATITVQIMKPGVSIQ